MGRLHYIVSFVAGAASASILLLAVQGTGQVGPAANHDERDEKQGLAGVCLPEHEVSRIEAEQPVRVPVFSAEVDRLTHERDWWEDYAKRLEKNNPVERFARELALTPEDVQRRMDRSELFRNVEEITLASQRMTMHEIEAALAAEREYYVALAAIKSRAQLASAPADQKQWLRQHHHDTVVVPWIQQRALALCDKLYELRCPSSVVERLRTRLMEDI